MSRLGTNIWVVLAMLIGAGPAHAGLVYSYSTDQSVYNVAPGGTIGVQVFLNETGLPGDPFVLAPGGDGMFSTGVRLNYSASAAALVLSGGDIIGNPAFDNGPPRLTPSARTWIRRLRRRVLHRTSSPTRLFTVFPP